MSAVRMLFMDRPFTFIRALQVTRPVMLETGTIRHLWMPPYQVVLGIFDDIYRQSLCFDVIYGWPHLFDPNYVYIYTNDTN